MNTKHTLVALLLAGGLLAATATQAGTDKPLSQKGYWVAEISEDQSDKTVVRYYSWQHQLVYTEVITGRKLKFNKKQLRELKEKTDIALSVASAQFNKFRQ